MIIMSKNKKAIVYIDGENFLHRAEDSLKLAKKINNKLEIINIDIKSILEDTLADYKSLEIKYYGTKIRVGNIEDKEILKHAEQIIESQRRFKRNLERQGIKFITSGSLRVREAKCRKCHKKTLIFKEKGVDVRIAVDLIQEAGHSHDQIIVSSDSDLLPAVSAVKKKGAHICYVYYSPMPNYAMIKVSDESRVYTDSQIEANYKK